MFRSLPQLAKVFSKEGGSPSHPHARCKFCKTVLKSTETIRLVNHCRRCKKIPDDIRLDIDSQPPSSATKKTAKQPEKSKGASKVVPRRGDMASFKQDIAEVDKKLDKIQTDLQAEKTQAEMRYQSVFEKLEKFETLLESLKTDQAK